MPATSEKPAVAKVWIGDETCSFCQQNFKELGLEFLIDGKTVYGLWATLCEPCYAMHGVGLGQGLGQKYQLQANGDYVKVAG